MTDGVTLSTPIKLPVRACALFGDVHVGILGEMKEAELQANELVHAPVKLSASFSHFFHFVAGHDEDGFRVQQGGGGEQVPQGDGPGRRRQGLLRRVHGQVEDHVRRT